VCAAQPTPNDKDLDPPPPKDDDPEGLKLIGSADVLERASKLLQPLMTLAPNIIDVWIAVYDVSIRRSEHLFLARTAHKLCYRTYHPSQKNYYRLLEL